MARDYKKQAAWKRANQVYIGLALSKSTDADIVDYMDQKIQEGETKQGIIKRSLRHTMQGEGYKAPEGEGREDAE